MKKDCFKTVLFGLGYSTLGSLAYLWMRYALGLDVAIYPYQKPLMLVVAVIALIACVILLVFDIRRKCACRLRNRIIIVLATLLITFHGFSQLWGILMIYIGGW